LLLGACAHSGGGSRPAGHASAAEAGIAANGVLIRALGLVGTPYRYGGNSPAGGFDCSGLVQFVFRDSAGLYLPRSTRELVAMDARRVDRDELRPGDLVFFNPGGGHPSHIGIYVGEGRFVHAPSSGGTVRLDQLEADYWRRAYAGARRIL
jgi:cell wall-associated NlpC family hydrolase